MADKIQFRRDTAGNWASVNPILSAGELGLETDTLAYKIGNGIAAWNALSYAQLNGQMQNALLLAEPSAAPAAGIYLFPRSVGGRFLPAFLGPSNVSSSLQPFLGRNKIGYWCPPGNANTAPGVLGYTAHTATGTATARNVATTNLFTRLRRLGYVSAATAAALAGARVAVAQITTGDGNGLGGFHKVIRWGISDAALVATARSFVGVSANTGVPTNVEPSTLVNSIGMGHGASDTNMRLYFGGSVAQPSIDLGANFPSNTTNVDVYELVLYASPKDNSKLFWQVTRVNTGHTISGTINNSNPGVTLPAFTTLLTYCQVWRSNNATAAAVGIDIMSDYIETDD
jgi:hypothetical protein